MKNVTAPFSYYGGKSKLSHLFPVPLHDTIVEPFCGGASYSFRYWERQVRLNDLDKETFAIWKFLTSPVAADDIEREVPSNVRAGQRVSELGITQDGLSALLRAEANQGTQGAKGVHDQITERGAVIWNRSLKVKLLEHVVPKVGHWIVSQNDYKNLPDTKATWFVDPPYANTAGSRYRTNVVDYEELASWCCSRTGQVIVCENEGADWLPFEPLARRRGFVSSYQKSNALEVVYSQR